MCIRDRPKGCDEAPCLNGGECVDDVNNVKVCKCPESFTGDRCQVEDAGKGVT